MKSKSPGGIVIAAVAAVLMAGGIVADRLGAPADLSAGLVALVAGASLTAAGLSTRTMRPSIYFAGGRSYSTLAGSGLILAVLFALSATWVEPTGMLNAPTLAVVGAGALIHALAAAPALRLAGGLTFADTVQGRFRSRMVTFAAAVTAFLICGALALVLGPAAVSTLQEAGGLSAGLAAGLVILLAFTTIFTGGMSGLIAAAASACVLLAAGWGAPLGSLLLAGPDQRTEWLGKVVAAIENFEVTPAGLGLALSAAGLLTVMNSATAATSAATARRSVLIATAALLVAGAAGLMANAALEQRTAGLSGQSARSLPAAIYSDAFKGQIKVCGAEPTTPDDLQRICERAGTGGPLPPAALQITDARSGRWFSAIMGLPPVIGAAFKLAVPFILLAAFAAASHGAAAALNQDILRRLVIPQSTTSGALALQRLTALAIIAVAALGPLRNLDADGRIMRLLLFAAASVPLPLLILGMLPGADWRAALCGLASTVLAGTGVWFGMLEGGLLYLAGTCAGLAAGVTAALVFPSHDERDGLAALVLRGRTPTPSAFDQSA